MCCTRFTRCLQTTGTQIKNRTDGINEKKSKTPSASCAPPKTSTPERGGVDRSFYNKNIHRLNTLPPSLLLLTPQASLTSLRFSLWSGSGGRTDYVRRVPPGKMHAMRSRMQMMYFINMGTMRERVRETRASTKIVKRRVALITRLRFV